MGCAAFLTPRYRRAIRLVAVFIGVLFLLQWQSRAQDFLNSVPRQDQEALRVLASSMSARAENSVWLIQQLGLASRFDQTWPKWREWPAVRILETAYISAEAARAHAGGELVLRRSVKIVADERSDAIRSEPALQTYFAPPTADALSVTNIPFVKPPEIELTRDLPEPIREVIRILSIHVASVPGGTVALVKSCCNLTDAQAYDVERRADSVEAALAHAIAIGERPPGIDERTWRLITSVANWNDAMVYDPAWGDKASLLRPLPGATPGRLLRIQSVVTTSLQTTTTPLSSTVPKDAADIVSAARTPVSEHPRQDVTATPGTHNQSGGLPPDNPDLTQGSGAGGGPIHPGSGGPVMTAHASAPPGAPVPGNDAGMAETRYSNFRDLNYEPKAGGGGSMLFRAMVAEEGGFGGVIFGSDVVSAAGLPKVKSLRWVHVDEAPSRWSPEAEPWGYFEFTFQDGTVGRSRITPEDHATVAHELIYAQATFVGGQGIGLAGFDGRTQHLVVRSGLVRGREHGALFVVNPALAQHRIGRSAMIVDLLAYTPDNWGSEMAPDIVAMASKAGANDEEIGRITDWRDADKGEYKFTDVPMEVRRDPAGLMSVVRQAEPNKSWSEALRSQALLTMQTFTDGEPDPDGHVPFYQLVPLLTAVSSDVDRLNDFAGTLALVRWARQSSAEWRGDVPNSVALPVATAMFWSWRGSSFVSDETVMEEDLIREMDQEESRIAIADKSGTLATTSERLTKDRLHLLAEQKAIERLGGERLIVLRAAAHDPTIKPPEWLADSCPDDADLEGSDRVSSKALRIQIPELRALDTVCQAYQGTLDNDPLLSRRSLDSETVDRDRVFNLIYRLSSRPLPGSIVALRTDLDAAQTRMQEAQHNVDLLEDVPDDEELKPDARLLFASEAQRENWSALQSKRDSLFAKIGDEKTTNAQRRALRKQVSALDAQIAKALPNVDDATMREQKLDSLKKVAATAQTAMDELETRVRREEEDRLPGFNAWLRLQESYAGALAKD